MHDTLKHLLQKPKHNMELLQEQSNTKNIMKSLTISKQTEQSVAFLVISLLESHKWQARGHHQHIQDIFFAE